MLFQEKKKKETFRYNIEIYATLPGKTGTRAAATGGPMGQEVFSSASTSWSPPGKAGVYKYHLPGIFMTNSFRTWILAHLETLPCSVIPH